jgi:1-acyl-sn-glycerol-3-phosphate acyltransferase
MTGASRLPDIAWPWFHDLSRWVGSWLFRPFFRISVHERSLIPADGAVVLVANHSAAVDGPILYGIVGRRCVFLVKHEAYRGIVGFLLRRIGHLPVRRGEPARAPLLAAVHVLRAGGLVAVFPEGSRGDGNVLSAHHGAAWLARTSAATVLPVAVRGTRRPDRRRLRPQVDILVGTPLRVPAGGGRIGLAAATERIRSELGSLVSELDSIRAARPPAAACGVEGAASAGGPR